MEICSSTFWILRISPKTISKKIITNAVGVKLATLKLPEWNEIVFPYLFSKVILEYLIFFRSQYPSNIFVSIYCRIQTKNHPKAFPSLPHWRHPSHAEAPPIHPLQVPDPSYIHAAGPRRWSSAGTGEGGVQCQ